MSNALIIIFFIQINSPKTKIVSEILDVKNKINIKYPNVQVKTIITDFSHAYKKNYFKIFEKTINELPGELSILVNNVGYRVAGHNFLL